MNMIELTKIGTEHSLDKRESFLAQLKQSGNGSGILLQTCNRVEWYHGKGKISDDIAMHLFRVISGLESSIIGETAIVNQVKLAYQEAVKNSRLDKSIHKLFQTALFVSKRVRKETRISEGAMSHSQAVVNILDKNNAELSGLKITLLGVNKLNENIIQFLLNKGASAIFIGNRTFEKAQELASKYDSKALHFDSLRETIENTDVLISATSAPHYVLKKETFSTTKPITIFDLAVPRDVDPGIGKLPNVRLFNIEEIEKQVEQNVQERRAKVAMAENIIEKEVQIFIKNQSNGEGRK